jgi:predicted metal-dependent phosphoesterase TrpH
MLKAELHAHIDQDPLDKGEIAFSAKQLIDAAAEQGFQVLAITCHNHVYSNLEMERYAWEKGIVLLSGVELTVERKHVLVYNLQPGKMGTIKTLAELEELKKNHPEMLVIAPHPFHPNPSCLREKVLEHLGLFDLWEYSFFYTAGFNPNRKTERLAQQHQKPLVGCSDVHYLSDLGRTYTLIDCPLNKQAIFRALRAGKVEVKTTPLSLAAFLSITARVIHGDWKKKFE